MRDRYDLVIVGMGSGGMVGAEFAASLGLKVAVVERGRVGGDCLWTGCVPSKALLASAKVAHHMRNADEFGLPAVAPEIDRSLVWKRIRRIQEEIAETDDDPERFRRLGVDIVVGTARVTGPQEVDVEGRRLRARFVLLCTGSRPVVPPIPGLADVGFLTSESLFEIESPPSSMVVIGGGPIAIEMAQGMNRLGMSVTVLQRGPGILPRDEPELVATLTECLRIEGVNLVLDVETTAVQRSRDGGKTVRGTVGGEPAAWSAEEILVAAGRAPNVESLGLQAVGVEVGPRGVVVDSRMRTNVPSIYAAGDVAGRFLFTHNASHEAVRAIRDMFFPGRGAASDFVPWCTFTDPELAHAGLTAAEATARFGDDATTWRIDLAHSDRARAEGTPTGRIVAVTGPKGRLVGAHVLAPAAGELIHELALAIEERLRFAELAGMIHVYPTLSSSVFQLAAEATFESAKRLRWLTRLRLPFRP